MYGFVWSVYDEWTSSLRTMSRKTGQVPRGTPSSGVTMCIVDVMGIRWFPVYTSSEGLAWCSPSLSSVSRPRGASSERGWLEVHVSGKDFCCCAVAVGYSHSSSCNSAAEERTEDRNNREWLGQTVTFVLANLDRSRPRQATCSAVVVLMVQATRKKVHEKQGKGLSTALLGCENSQRAWHRPSTNQNSPEQIWHRWREIRVLKWCHVSYINCILTFIIRQPRLPGFPGFPHVGPWSFWVATVHSFRLAPRNLPERNVSEPFNPVEVGYVLSASVPSSKEVTAISIINALFLQSWNQFFNECTLT